MGDSEGRAAIIYFGDSLAGRERGEIYLIGYYGLLRELRAALYYCRGSEEGE
jgi:hypothetical protein